MKSKITLFCAFAALGALIFASESVLASSREALSLCAELIIPSLFPFFVMSILLNRLGLPKAMSRVLGSLAEKLFNVSGTGVTALIIGLTGGYPLGAAYIADMCRAESISTDEGEQLLSFCNNSGPAFIVGAVGAGTFRSVRAGLYLYGVHIIAAVITGIITRPKTKAGTNHVDLSFNNCSLSFSSIFPDAVKAAVAAVINVCGFVVCFSVIVGLIDSHGAFSSFIGQAASHTGMELHWMRSLFTGLIELGSGIGLMRAMSITPINLALAAFLLGWGGLSVHFQTMAVISDSGIKGALHFAGRLISASIAACLAYIMFYAVF